MDVAPEEVTSRLGWSRECIGGRPWSHDDISLVDLLCCGLILINSEVMRYAVVLVIEVDGDLSPRWNGYGGRVEGHVFGDEVNGRARLGATGRLSTVTLTVSVTGGVSGVLSLFTSSVENVCRPGVNSVQLLLVLDVGYISAGLCGSRLVRSSQVPGHPCSR